MLYAAGPMISNVVAEAWLRVFQGGVDWRLPAMVTNDWRRRDRGIGRDRRLATMVPNDWRRLVRWVVFRIRHQRRLATMVAGIVWHLSSSCCNSAHRKPGVP